MGRFEPVIIEREGGHYTIRQGTEPLLRVPGEIFDSYSADTVFVPLWSLTGLESPVQEPRYLLYHPPTRELLMSAVRPRPPLLAEVYGSHPFRSYLQIYWIPERTRLVLRTYWNPESPADAFDLAARKESYRVQREFLSIIWRLRPPSALTVTLNAVERYQRLAGLDGGGAEAQPDAIFNLFLAPPGELTNPQVAQALEAICVNHAGRAYPVVDERRLLAIEALGEEELADVKKKLDESGVGHGAQAYRTH